MPKATAAREPIFTLPMVKAIPLNCLSHDFDAPEGSGIRAVRTTDRFEGLGELVASIRALGLIVPLVYKEYEGQHYVVAGNRRLKALREIHGEMSDGPVLCYNVDSLKGSAAEVALADNIIRAPLHPVDKFEAFGILIITEGLSPQDVAGKFGIPMRQVDQALALARLAPEIRTAWRAKVISAEIAQAFTIEPDHVRQTKVFAKLKKTDKLWDQSIRHELVGDRSQAANLIHFIGIEAYEAAGGKVQVDLFRGFHAVSDVALAKRLADEKAEAECVKLVEAGWGWARLSTHPDVYNRHYMFKRHEPTFKPTPEEKRRLAEIERLLEDDSAADEIDAEALDAEADTINAGIAQRAWDASPRKKKNLGCVLTLNNSGRLRIESGYVMPQETERTDDSAGKAGGGDKKKGAKAKKPKPGEVSNALGKRLEHQMLAATQRALREEAKLFDARGSVGDSLAATLARIAADLTLSRNEWNRALTDDMLKRIREHIDREILNGACLKEFDAKDYFASVPKAMCVAVLTEMGEDALANAAAGKTKDEMAKHAVARAEAFGWLPPALRTSGYAAGRAEPAKRGAAQPRAGKKRARRSH